jgi:hypothetical protein
LPRVVDSSVINDILLFEFIIFVVNVFLIHFQCG